MVQYLQESSDEMENILLEPIRNSEDIVLFDTEEGLDFSDSCGELSSVEAGVHLYSLDDDLLEDDYDEAYKEKKSVGQFLGRFFDVEYSLDTGLDLFSMFDMPDEISADLVGTLLAEDLDFRNDVIPGNIYHLEEITIDEDYAGKGYGKMIVENIQKMLSYVLKLNVTDIVVQESVLKQIYDNEIEAIKEEYDSFEEFYEFAGFEYLEDTEYLINYMWKENDIWN